MTDEQVKEIKDKITLEAGSVALFCLLFFGMLLWLTLSNDNKTQDKLDHIQQQCAPR